MKDSGHTGVPLEMTVYRVLGVKPLLLLTLAVKYYSLGRLYNPKSYGTKGHSMWQLPGSDNPIPKRFFAY